jgi:hypothetical protein
MRDYRAFVMGPDGHIVNRVEFFSEDDEQAREHAKQFVDGHDIELWHLDQRIAEFKSKQPP